MLGRRSGIREHRRRSVNVPGKTPEEWKDSGGDKEGSSLGTPGF